ncbi:MAG: uroporphyrinogen decarboxylase family protein [bacterium]
MNSRERVNKTINFQEPDRVPIDLAGTTGASGIHLLAYDKLQRYLGLNEKHVKCDDLMQQLAVLSPAVRQRLHVDTFPIDLSCVSKNWHSCSLYDGIDVRTPIQPDLQRLGDGSWLLKDKAGHEYLKPPHSYYFDARDGQSWYSFGIPLTDELLQDLSDYAHRLYTTTDLALSAKFGGGFFGNTPEFLMDLATEPERMDDQNAAACDALIERYKRLHQAIGRYSFCVIFADDFGTQNAPMISPDMFRERMMPHYRKFSQWLHANTNWKLFLHCCGAVEPLIESFIEMGVDILNPIQTSASGMDPVLLKQKYGGRIVFWGGGCDTQRVLGFRSPDEVREHVKERIRIFAPGGGFVFNQVHAIQATIDPESICAMFDTAHDFGQYTDIT